MESIYKKVLSFLLVDACKIQLGLEAKTSSAWENANVYMLVILSCHGSNPDIYICVDIYMFILRPWIRGWKSEGEIGI